MSISFVDLLLDIVMVITGSNNLLGPHTDVLPYGMMTRKVGLSSKPFFYLMCISPTLIFCPFKTLFSALTTFAPTLKSVNYFFVVK